MLSSLTLLLRRATARLRHIASRHFANRMSGAAVFFSEFLAVALLTRCALLVKSASAVDFGAELAGAFTTGAVFDIGTGLFPAALVAVVLAALPRGFFTHSPGRVLAWVGVGAGAGLLLFGAVAEWLFWDEFGTRFNFIAVDYLIYTKEVAANIHESYPLPAIFGALALVSAALALGLGRIGAVAIWMNTPALPARQRWLVAAGWVGVAVLGAFALDSGRAPAFANTYNAELSRNGLWSLFAAFRNNELDYDQFYATLPREAAFARLDTELARDGGPRGGSMNTLRVVKNRGPELHPNVIQITVESLSADFLGVFNPKSTLTPNLDALARESLVFENFYATGTRTDRGMEALTLSLPPTPGRSIIKRPANAGLFTLGSLFRSRGYDTAFIYGGHGYFDNMNAFFGGNGYRVVDRASVASSDVTFANAWGACDEDLFRWTLREAETSAARGRPFHFFVMTTSNHRPFSFPEGRIDLSSKTSGRAGAIKYTDYAIGRFLRDAATRPWFKNTVFVIVADHCASSAGKTALPVQRYHIPLFIYAPGGQIAPGRVTQLASQIDYAPTLLGRLGWSYATRFYGRDVLATPGGGRALIGNYQKLGLFDGSHLAVLSPLRGTAQFDHAAATHALTPVPEDPRLRETTIAYYQTAAWLYRHGHYNALSNEEQQRLVAKAGVGAGANDAAKHAPTP